MSMEIFMIVLSIVIASIIIFFVLRTLNNNTKVRYYKDYLIYKKEKISYSSIIDFSMNKISYNSLGERYTGPAPMWITYANKEIPCRLSRKKINKMININYDVRQKAIRQISNYYKTQISDIKFCVIVILVFIGIIGIQLLLKKLIFS